MNQKRLNWDPHHYRFGLAGEGQADVIQGYLERDQGRVLNIGCGPWGDKIKNLSSYCDLLIAADISFDGVKRARPEIWPYALRRITFLVADARNLPLENSSMDHIVALGLFAEIADADVLGVLSELHRVCRQDGHLMITNAVCHPIETYIELGTRAGFRLIEEPSCGYCPAASGSVQERYLLVFAKSR
ncbi:MAG TPA: class I SAM-dependent methyltransferase [Blastocatellia bacterium]|nr:class I SAM-dependent methyltransferase [Blastocatellia bacterium]